jgi:hypothetical protein
VDDCAPLDAAVYPGAVEICDGLDQDCDERVDEGEPAEAPLACALDEGVEGICKDGACVDPCDAAIDLPDEAFEDANCDGIDGDVSMAIFVAPAQWDGDDFNPGTMELPKLTIEAALAAAESSGKTMVLVSAGTYSGPITLRPGISIYGGFHKPLDWARSVDHVCTILVDAPDEAGQQVGVYAHDIPAEAPVVFDRMRVEIADNATAGGSNYGVHGVGAPGLTLSHLDLDMGKAGDGASRTTPGETPSAKGYNGYYGYSGSESDDTFGCWCKSYGSPSVGTGASARTCPYGGKSGAGGKGGYAGYKGGAGSDGYSGWANEDGSAAGGVYGAGGTSTGYDGGFGASGPAGLDASGGGGFGRFSGGFYAPSHGAAVVAPTDGRSGGGAGGGGGSGGCGGQKGLSGDGGGAAFGVLSFGPQPLVSGVSVVLAGGGAGGAASAGGSGTNGGSGGSGGGSSVTYADDGGDGGIGGDGGRGGHGGGGGGGPAVCFQYVLDEGEPSPDLLIDGLCENAGGGAGGGSPGNAGAAGVAAETSACLSATCAP